MASQLERAQQILLDAARTVGTERQALQQCWQRVLAEDIIAGIDFPPFDRSPLDGYALIAKEVETATAAAPVVLRQIESVAAGEVAKRTVRPGTACRIMTGAPLPAGATGVVRLEDTISRGDWIEVRHGLGASNNVCRRGDVIGRGERMLSSGKVINRGVMGTLALLGRSNPMVFKRPRVGLLATGSEIVAIDAQLTPGKIHDLNSYMLSAQVREAGGEPLFLGVIGDAVEAICQGIDQAVDCDMIVTTGGVSVGDYDLMRQAFARLGIALLSENCSMKPGMFLLAGLRNGQLCIGLSGNPAAAGISFEQILWPVLLKMGGRKSWRRHSVLGKMAKPYTKGFGPKRFLWAHSWLDQDDLVVEPLPLRWNGMLRSAMTANSLIAVDENCPPIEKGEDIEVILLH
jgi:molybdopterin molybdotransferase